VTPSRIVLGTAVAVAVAGGVAGCAPGPAGYAGWANYRQHQAEEHAYFSQRNAEAAQRQAARGDYSGAQQSQAAADAEAAQAEQAHQRAARDRWLSQF
jgi:hypothetical protein